MSVKRITQRIVVVALLSLVLVVAFAGGALAASHWSDINAGVLAPYGLTESDLAAISEGYDDGTWRPYNDMPRRQFVKMAVTAFDIPTATPATPTFSDVSPSNEYYPYIEGAVAAGLVEGTGGGMFQPNAIVSRQQGVAIVARWMAEEWMVDLESRYTNAQAAAILAPFSDASHVSAELTKEMAFAVEQGIVKGSAGKLNPTQPLTRIQGAAVIVRTMERLEQDIVDIAVADGRFTTLVGALEATGLDDALRGPGPFTVFAPTDAAFALLPAGLLASLTTQQLTDILLYHVASGRLPASDVVELDGELVPTLLAGQEVLVTVDGGVKINDADVIITDVFASNGIIHVIDAVLIPPGDIVDVAEADGRFTTLVGALEATGLDDALRAPGPFTVFAPTDAAFALLPEGLLESLTTEQLTDILLYHVVSGQLVANDVVELDGELVPTLLAGQEVLVTVNGGVMINDANVIITNVIASNGIIHVIDAVLVPPGDIVDVAEADGRFTTLVGALEATGLDDALRGPGPFTVFAPTDDAFALLPAGLLASLTTEQLTDILLYHVVSGQFVANDVVELDGELVPTLLVGQEVLVTVNGGVMINDANVIITNVIASNGIIHVIDAVLIPPED